MSFMYNAQNRDGPPPWHPPAVLMVTIIPSAAAAARSHTLRVQPLPIVHL